jgi:hypothetical protein
VNKCELPLKFGPCNSDGGGPNGTACMNAQNQCKKMCVAQHPMKTVQPTCNGVVALPNVSYTSPALPISAFGNQTWNYNSLGVAHYAKLKSYRVARRLFNCRAD